MNYNQTKLKARTRSYSSNIKNNMSHIIFRELLFKSSVPKFKIIPMDIESKMAVRADLAL